MGDGESVVLYNVTDCSCNREVLLDELRIHIAGKLYIILRIFDVQMPHKGCEYRERAIDVLAGFCYLSHGMDTGCVTDIMYSSLVPGWCNLDLGFVQNKAETVDKTYPLDSITS